MKNTSLIFIPHPSSLIPSEAPRPGVEPGTSRSRRGMMSVSPPGRAFLTVDLPRIELGSPACRAGVVPLDHRPVRQWTAGESNPNLRRAIPASSRWTSSPFYPEVRPGLEPGLPPYQRGVPPQHLQTDRAERRTSAGDNRLGAPACLYRRPRTLRPTVAEVGIEPTVVSPGSRPGRFACLRTRPSISPGPR